jgi:hypothetical protein
MKIMTRLTPRYYHGTANAKRQPPKAVIPKKPKPKETGPITERHQAYRRSVLCHSSVFVDTYFYDNETEAVQAGAVFEMYTYAVPREKAASGRKKELDFVHPVHGQLFAAAVFDY